MQAVPSRSSGNRGSRDDLTSRSTPCRFRRPIERARSFPESNKNRQSKDLSASDFSSLCMTLWTNLLGYFNSLCHPEPQAKDLGARYNPKEQILRRRLLRTTCWRSTRTRTHSRECLAIHLAESSQGPFSRESNLPCENLHPMPSRPA